MHQNLFLVLFYGLLVLIACKPKEENNNTIPVTYPVVSPIVTDTTHTTEYVADIHSFQNVEIRAKVKGYLEKIYIDEGKPVKAGQTLFSISSQGFKEEELKAIAMVKSAIAETKTAELELQNVKTLSEKNIVSKTELEKAQANLDALYAKVEEAKAHQASAALHIAYTQIKAPFDGIINRMPFKIGSLIDEGTLLTTLSNNKEVYAYFNVSESEYFDILAQKNSAPTQTVALRLANNEPYPIQGRIETVESEFDKSTGNIAFRARFANPDGILKHGASGKILLKKNLYKALVIPQKATFEIQDKVYVFVVATDSTVQMRNIFIKERLPLLFVVGTGLQPKDKILYEGIQQVKQGDKIIPRILNFREILAKANQE